jgi:hypothetical protein
MRGVRWIIREGGGKGRFGISSTWFRERRLKVHAAVEAVKQFGAYRNGDNRQAKFIRPNFPPFEKWCEKHGCLYNPLKLH